MTKHHAHIRSVIDCSGENDTPSTAIVPEEYVPIITDLKKRRAVVAAGYLASAKKDKRDEDVMPSGVSGDKAAVVDELIPAEETSNETKKSPSARVNRSQGVEDADLTNGGNTGNAESQIDAFLRRRCELAIESKKKEISERKRRSKDSDLGASKVPTYTDKNSLKFRLKDVTTRTELAAKIGVNVKAISLVTLTSKTCRIEGCNLLAAQSNFSSCILCQQSWFPRWERNRGHGLYGRKFLRLNGSATSTIPPSCCCENPLCLKLGYSHEGMLCGPTNPLHCTEFLRLLGIRSSERREKMAETPRRYRFAPWHFSPMHRVRGSNGSWRLRKMTEYVDADGNVFPFAPPNGDIQQFIDYEIPGAFSLYDDALPAWFGKLSRLQDGGVLSPSDIASINENTPSFPPLPSSCKMENEEDDPKASEIEEKDNKESTSPQQSLPVVPPPPSWEQLFFQLSLYRARNGGSSNVPRKFNVDVPEWTSRVYLGEWVNKMRAFKQLLEIPSENRSHYEPYFTEAASVLTPDRIEALDSVGLSWEIDRPRPKITWEVRYDELARHHAEHGNCQPMDNPKLLRWCYQQRQQINSALKDAEEISEDGKGLIDRKEVWRERKAKLDELDFCWQLTSAHISWEDRFEALKQYKEEHGHCSVKRSHNASLGTWVGKIRTDYLHKIEGKKSPLTEERIHLLESIGFKWLMKKRRPQHRHNSSDKENSGDSEDDESTSS